MRKLFPQKQYCHGIGISRKGMKDMNILRCENARFAGGVMLLMLLVSAFTWPGAAVAEERDFPAGGPKEKLVEEAIKFIKDNEGTDPTDADEDLTAKLATNPNIAISININPKSPIFA